MTTRKELEERLSKENELRQQLKLFEGQTREMKLELAGKVVADLFKQSDKVAAHFSNGGLAKDYEKVLDLLDELAGLDAKYLNELGKPEPYGLQVSESQAYFKGLFGKVIRRESGLFGLIQKLIANRGMQGSPLYKKGNS